MAFVPFKKRWIIEKEKRKKKTCIKIVFVFVLDYRCLWGSSSMSGVGRRVLRDMDSCCSHSNRGSPPFALSLSSFAHQSTCGRLTPALPKHLAWRGEGTETPVPTMWPSMFFTCLSVVLTESSVWGFFAVFELVASAFSKGRVEAPSRAAQFDLVLKSQREVYI